MTQQRDSSQKIRHADNDAVHRVPLHPVSQFKSQVRVRWRKSILSYIFIAFLLSILVHLSIGAILELTITAGATVGSGDESIDIEFAIQNTEELTQLPEGQQLTQKDSIPTEISSEQMQSTQASFTADTSATSLEITAHATHPSLAGGAGAGSTSRMGGSGGVTSFFGISSSGSRFCYIVDISGSMNQQNRLDSAIAELTKSLKRLPDFARFYILFYSSQISEPNSQNGWNTARSSSIRRITKDFRDLRAGGGTNPNPAFEQALQLNPPPDVIFFLTDGEISGFSVDTLRALLPKGSRVIVNTIAFGNASSQQKLIDIAKATGGQYKFVPSGGTP